MSVIAWSVCIKKSVGIACSRYRCDSQGHYLSVDDGAAGFIDFALGRYARPTIGIELTLKLGWRHEEVVYDLLKLLDARNPFDFVVSLNLLLRPKGIAGDGDRDALHHRMVDAYRDTTSRLDYHLADSNRRRSLIVAEIAPDQRKYWHHDSTADDLLETDGLPPACDVPFRLTWLVA